MENSKIKKILATFGLGGSLAIGLIVILGLLVVSPLLLICGLNLLGFDVPLSFQTVFGAILVVLVLRSPSQK
jgi:hypothetical protein